MAALGIVVMAFLLIFSVNSLQWPLASSIGKVITILPSPTKIPDGILVVSVQSNTTVVSPSGSFSVGVPGFFVYNGEQTFPGVRISVYLSGSLSTTVSNITDSAGQVEEVLAPDAYTVILPDWRLNNLSVPIQISSDKITKINVQVNADSYTIQSASISDPDSSGFAVSWGSIFVRLSTNQTIASQNIQTFLDTAYPAGTPLDRIQQAGVAPITVGSSSPGNDSQWVEILVTSPLNISSIKSMSLLTLHTQYEVNTTVVQ